MQRNHLISDRAVWHMTHLGTLSEAVAGMDGNPDMELDFGQPFLDKAPRDPVQFNEWAATREEGFAANSQQLIEGAGEADEELEADLKRLAGHDKFQIAQFRLKDDE